MLEAVVNAFKIPDLRRKILFTLAMLVIFRFIASIPVPGVDRQGLQDYIESNQLLGMLNLFSGSGLKQLLDCGAGGLSVHHSVDHHAADDADHPAPERALEGGPAGPEQDQPVHALSDRSPGVAAGIRPRTALLPNQTSTARRPLRTSVCSIATPFCRSLAILLSMTAGTMLLVWMGELITENGIGNGVSIIIFGGIVASLPEAVGQLVTGGSTQQNIIGTVFFVAHRAGDRGRHRAHQRGPAPDSGAPCQANSRGQAVWRQHHLHSAEGQLGRHDPADLRGQHHGLPGHDRQLPGRLESRLGAQMSPATCSASSARHTSSTTSIYFLMVVGVHLLLHDGGLPATEDSGNSAAPGRIHPWCAAGQEHGDRICNRC